MSNNTDHARLSVSSWSLHRTLGAPTIYGPPISSPEGAQNRAALLNLPALVQSLGIGTLELCHFHLPTLEQDYLDELRRQLEAADVELWSFLVDAGDVTHAQNAAGHEQWIENWFSVAARLGARGVRVIAGYAAPNSQSIAQSRAALSRLARSAQTHGLQLLTENWFDLLSTPESVHSVLGSLQGEVGLCLDFGNWDGPHKYEQLASIAPFALGCHARADFVAPGVLDETDFRRCLELTRAAGFRGPYTLIPSGKVEDEIEAIKIARGVARDYLS